MERVVLGVGILIFINFIIIIKMNRNINKIKDEKKRVIKELETKAKQEYKILNDEAIKISEQNNNEIATLKDSQEFLRREIEEKKTTILSKESDLKTKQELIEEIKKEKEGLVESNEILLEVKKEKIKRLETEHEEYVARYQKITANIGEDYTKKFLENYSNVAGIRTLHNIIFKHKNEFRQADHLVIAEKGIMVVETKFSSGKVLLGLNNSKDCEILRDVLSMKSSSFDNVTNFTGSNKYFSINITNPLSQSSSASFLLKEYIESYFENIEINNYSTVIILPEVKEDRNPQIIDLRNESKCNYFNSISKDFKELKTNIDDFIVPKNNNKKKLSQNDINKIYDLLTNSLKFTNKEIFK